MKHQKKIPALLTVGVLVVLTIGGGFYFSKQKNQQASSDAPKDWQIFRNDVIGFEFKYPTDWQVVDGAGGKFYSVTLEDTKRPIVADTDIPSNHITISEFSGQANPPCLSSSDWDEGLGGSVYRTACFDGKPNFAIALFAADESGRITADAIVSSFKFTTPFKSWKTYTNKQVGFQVEAPAGWLYSEELCNPETVECDESNTTFTNPAYKRIEKASGNRASYEVSAARMSVYILKNNQSFKTIEELRAFNREEQKGNTIESENVFTVDGEKVLAYQVKYNDNRRVYFLESLHNGAWIRISLEGEDTGWGAMFLHVQSTFKFIAPVASSKADEVGNWKTYTNRERGFSIDYPESMAVGIDERGVNGYYSFDISQDVSNPEHVVVVTDSTQSECVGSGNNTVTQMIHGMSFIRYPAEVYEGGVAIPFIEHRYCAARNGVTYWIMTQLFYSVAMGPKYDETDLIENEILNRMVKSFRFTN